eukprot:sb/3468371/
MATPPCYKPNSRGKHQLLYKHYRFKDMEDAGSTSWPVYLPSLGKCLLLISNYPITRVTYHPIPEGGVTSTRYTFCRPDLGYVFLTGESEKHKIKIDELAVFELIKYNQFATNWSWVCVIWSKALFTVAHQRWPLCKYVFGCCGRRCPVCKKVYLVEVTPPSRMGWYAIVGSFATTECIMMMPLFTVGPRFSAPDLVTPRFSDRINFPRYRKVTVFDPDLVPTPIYAHPPRMSLNRGPSVLVFSILLNKDIYVQGVPLSLHHL